MEVHHQPGLNHRKKKFGEYFLEFLMIFLAVTLGFFAESFRERLLSKEKEHHYMQSMVQDLKKDTAELSQVIALQNITLKAIDNALQIPVEKLKDSAFQHSFYHYFVYFYSYDFLFVQHDKTAVQLKNAGGFGVIRKPAVADSIAEFNLFYEQAVKFDGDYYDSWEKKMIDIGAREFKMSELSDAGDTLSTKYPPGIGDIIHYDPDKLQELYSWIRNVKGCLIIYMGDELNYRKMATRLINFINKEYHL